MKHPFGKDGSPSALRAAGFPRRLCRKALCLASWTENLCSCSRGAFPRHRPRIHLVKERQPSLDVSMLTHPQSISVGSSGVTEGSRPSRDRGNEDASGARRTARRELPASVAAAMLMTMDYAGAEQPGTGPTCISGRLPAHLCRIDGRDWHDDWTGTADGIWMTPIGGARVRFAPPSGFSGALRRDRAARRRTQARDPATDPAGPSDIGIRHGRGRSRRRAAPDRVRWSLWRPRLGGLAGASRERRDGPRQDGARHGARDARSCGPVAALSRSPGGQ